MTQQYLRDVCSEGQGVNPLFDTLEARITRVENGEAEMRLPISRRICQGGGMVAGGILATMADEAMAHAVMSILGDHQATVTAEMNVRYLRGADARKGGELRCLARLVKRGQHICVAEAEVRDQDNRQLIIAGASFFLLEV
jgi:uncharacterized protein (TIGR00369 family)